MTSRRSAPVLLLLCALTLAGCSTLQSLVVVPGAGIQTLTNPGQTAQFKAIATKQMGQADPTTDDVTRSVTWSVTTPSVATIDSSGLATAVGAGKTVVTAQLNGVTGTSDLTVTDSSGSQAAPTITVIPGSGAAVATFVGETT